MYYGNEEKGVFTKHFDRQLQTSFEENSKNGFVTYSLSLPGNSRFSYTNKNFILQELFISLKKIYPQGVRLLYVQPHQNDDHIIEVGVLYKFNLNRGFDLT